MKYELIYYVDNNDNPTGETCEKYAAHTANTRLHAAFSVYVFNKRGQLLVTRRAKGKKVWPGFWTNTACGHPMPNESRTDAILRRLDYELGTTASNIQVILPKYIYKTPPYKGIIEHEFCPVFVAVSDAEPIPNPNEVSDYKWLDWAEFMAMAEADSKLPKSKQQWSWWCKDQLKQLKTNKTFNDHINKLATS